ncbi:MAG: hypothetical protein DMG08_11305, partial [Acidobacteria bacterium]
CTEREFGFASLTAKDARTPRITKTIWLWLGRARLIRSIRENSCSMVKLRDWLLYFVVFMK